jgi:predicted nucleic acid-binding protein
VATVEIVGAADLESAWNIGDAFPDQDFSLVNRTSFAVMQRLGVHRVVTFDDDFTIFRFGPRRERAFEVTR